MIWKTRLTLEATAHQHNSFVTLTYSEANLVYSIQARAPTLIPNDLKNWLYRLREAIKPTRIRFYAAGEYGDARERPHYHAILFGLKGCAYGKSRYADGKTIDCCYACDLIRDTWQKGIIECQPMAPEHAGYIAGYVMKKMTSKHDQRLKGRHPEFARMSNQNGGIGICAVPGLAQVGAQRIKAGVADDVPHTVRFEGKTHQLGRYLRQQTRKAMGGDGKAPDHVRREAEAKMLPLLANSRVHPVDITLKKQLVSKAQGSINAIKARSEINTRKRNKTL